MGVSRQFLKLNSTNYSELTEDMHFTLNSRQFKLFKVEKRITQIAMV